MEISKTKVEDFINTLEGQSRLDILKLHNEFSKALSGSKPVLWEGKFWGGSNQNIIGYGTYSYIRSDKKTGEWFIIGLAQQKNYITVFVNAANGKEYLTERYKDKLGKAKVGKSTINFKKLEDTSLDELLELVTKAFHLMHK